MRNNLILSGENSGFGSMITNGMKENADNVNGCGETNKLMEKGKFHIILHFSTRKMNYKNKTIM